jgi:AraC family transcriptional regulator of adaptative response / DNA-3-methyladenine glycosylase II
VTAGPGRGGRAAAPTAGHGPEPAPPSAPLRLRLRLPEPYDLGWVFGFLADRATPALERVEPGLLMRVVRLAGVPVLLTVRVRPGPDPRALRWLAVEAAPAASAARTATADAETACVAVPPLRRLVRRMLDLDTDLGPFLAMARRDPLLRPLVARHPGLRLPQLPDPFEGAVRAIVGQQVSVAAARTVVDRLIRTLGQPVAAAGGGLFAFPHPAAMAAAPAERLTVLGLTRAKAAALIAVAAATCDGALDWERLRAGSSEAAQAALIALPGVGPWTASYIRMRALGDRDAFPASDLGVVKALAALAPPASGRSQTVADIAALAERWRPFRAYAAIHLWRSLSP